MKGRKEGKFCSPLTTLAKVYYNNELTYLFDLNSVSGFRINNYVANIWYSPETEGKKISLTFVVRNDVASLQENVRNTLIGTDR